jgi:hypothetical protein
MEALFRDGKIVAESGEMLLHFLSGTVAPVIPYGASVIGLCNDKVAPVLRPTEVAKKTIVSPVPDTLQGGIKNCYGFFCIPCNDEASVASVSLVSDPVCLSPYPTTPHVLCSRICEGFLDALPPLS